MNTYMTVYVARTLEDELVRDAARPERRMAAELRVVRSRDRRRRRR